MVTNPQKGDEVWTLFGAIPKEITIFRVNKMTDRIHFYETGYPSDVWIEDCFPSLDALLSDLRERAIPITNNLEDTK